MKWSADCKPSSKWRKKTFHDIYYNIYTHEISTKLSHYFQTRYLLPKFSESRWNSPTCQAIKDNFSTREPLNLDYNPQRSWTVSMFAEYGTANSPLSKQLLRVTSIAGGPELQSQAPQTKESFTKQLGFPGKLYQSGVVWGIFHTECRASSVSRETQNDEQFYKTSRVSMATCALRGGMRFSILRQYMNFFQNKNK